MVFENSCLKPMKIFFQKLGCMSDFFRIIAKL